MTVAVRTLALLTAVIVVGNCDPAQQTRTENNALSKILRNPKWIEALPEIRKEWLGKLQLSIGHLQI